MKFAALVTAGLLIFSETGFGAAGVQCPPAKGMFKKWAELLKGQPAPANAEDFRGLTPGAQAKAGSSVAVKGPRGDFLRGKVIAEKNGNVLVEFSGGAQQWVPVDSLNNDPSKIRRLFAGRGEAKAGDMVLVKAEIGYVAAEVEAILPSGLFKLKGYDSPTLPIKISRSADVSRLYKTREQFVAGAAVGDEYLVQYSGGKYSPVTIEKVAGGQAYYRNSEGQLVPLRPNEVSSDPAKKVAQLLGAEPVAAGPNPAKASPIEPAEAKPEQVRRPPPPAGRRTPPPLPDFEELERAARAPASPPRGFRGPKTSAERVRAKFGGSRAIAVDNGVRRKKYRVPERPDPIYINANIQDRADALKAGKIFEGVSPSALPKGQTYTFVITQEGEMVFGLVDNSVEYGVKHMHLANGRKIMAGGELRPRPDGGFDYNLESGTFMRPLVEQHGVKVGQIAAKVKVLFEEEFGAKGTFTEEALIRPPGIDDFRQVCLFNYFYLVHAELCKSL